MSQTAEFDDVDSLISQILKYQKIKNATINAIHLQIGDLLYLFISESRQTSKKVIAPIKDQVNVNILEEYREILSNCGCNVCTVGEEVEPDRFGRLAANNYCCRVNDKMAPLSTKYNSFSARTLERFYNLKKKRKRKPLLYP